MMSFCYKDLKSLNCTQGGAVGGQIWTFGVKSRVHIAANLAGHPNWLVSNHGAPQLASFKP
eukprot:1161616-Pelagomonas_calceolata.AAC.7